MQTRAERSGLVLIKVENSNIKNGTFIIPEGVTSIGNSAFYFCETLTSITIPKSLKAIGSNTFSFCKNLTNITIPEGVTSIGSFAFSYCTNLTSITILQGVTLIGQCAFLNCAKLTNFTIPDGVTSIGIHAFYNCSPHLIITINTDDEAEVERIKQLLPPDLQKRVVSKRMSQEILKIQHDVIDGFLNKNSWLSPLRNLKIFCDDIKGTIASMFEDISTPLIKERILNVSIPQVTV